MDDREIIARYFDRDEAAIALTAQRRRGMCQRHLSAGVGDLPTERPDSLSAYLCHITRITDLAAAHGMSESRVKMTLLRMRKKLREHLIKEGFELW